MRSRKKRIKSSVEEAAEAFEKDFDSANPSTLIQFKRNRNARRQSRRLQSLSVLQAKTEKVGHADNVTQEEPEVVYRAPPVRYFKPMKGWDGSSRRVIQYAFRKLGSPTELNDANNNVWRGPEICHISRNKMSTNACRCSMDSTLHQLSIEHPHAFADSVVAKIWSPPVLAPLPCNFIIKATVQGFPQLTL